MRNEPLHAYSLHQRPFQEKRTIYYLLTKEYGVLHGIGRKGIPQFAPLTLFATGKKSLKTLQEVNIVDVVPSLIGEQQYAALYVNEITLKLLPLEDSVPSVYAQYSNTMQQLQLPLNRDELKLVLRLYEQILFNELGVAIDLEQDSEQALIESSTAYRFAPDRGWIKEFETKEHEIANTPLSSDNKTNHKTNHRTNHEATTSNRNPSFLLQAAPVLGETIIKMREGINLTTLNYWSLIHRQLIDHLFDYQPLQSRILWQQFYQYQ